MELGVTTEGKVAASNGSQRRVAIITGASRGIGAAAAEVLAARGMDLVLAVRDPVGAVEVARAVERGGAHSLVVACDVADSRAVATMVSQAIGRFGRIDVLINNAGVLEPIASVGQADEEAWLRNIGVNLIGAYRCVTGVLPQMLSRGGGTIINLSTKAAHKPFEGWSAYCAAKAGLAMLTQSIALEYGDRGIRTFGLAPGTTDTDMQGLIRASGVNPVSRIRKSDLIPVEEPAMAIAYLCGAEADDLAGRELELNEPALRQRIGIRVL